MKLTQRIKMTADLVPPCNSLIDVGTDHAYLPVYLCRKGIVKKAIASDISKGSAEKARQNAAAAGMENYIDVRCGSGLSVLNNGEYVDTIVCAGMGGVLITEILAGNKSALQNANFLVLQPQRHIDRVRSFVHNAGFKITHENMCFEGGKYYFAIKCIRGEDVPYSDEELLLGRFLPKTKNELFKTYLSQKIASKTASLKNAEEKNPSADLTKLKRLIELLKNIYKNTEEN